MSVDTELVLACNLKDDVPEEVLNLLRFLCGGPECPPKPADEDLPVHPFFRTQRWNQVLCNGSWFDPGETPSRLIVQEWKHVTGMKGPKSLTVRCDLKNYDFEIEYFLQWFAPYSKTIGFVGYFRHEESLHPTLIYFFDDGHVGLLIPTDSFMTESFIDLDAYLADEMQQREGEEAPDE